MVPVLPLEGWEERLRALETAVVLFTADWCGYCARFGPHFEAAATKTALPLLAADISDDEDDPRWEWYGIEVVPTVIAFQRGVPVARLDGRLGSGLKPSELDALVRGLSA